MPRFVASSTSPVLLYYVAQSQGWVARSPAGGGSTAHVAVVCVLPLLLAGLLGEGAVQVLYSTDEYITDPVLAAVGQLQFEVVQYRMKVRSVYGTGIR